MTDFVMLDSNLLLGRLDDDPVAQVLSAIGAGVDRLDSRGNVPGYRLQRVVVQHSVTPGVVVNLYAANGIPVAGIQVVQLRPDGKGEVFESDSAGKAQFNWGSASAFSNPGGGPYTVFVATGATRDEESKHVSSKGRLSDAVVSLGDFKAEHLQVYLQFVEPGATPPAPGRLDLRGVINALAQMHDAQASAMDALIGELEKLNRAVAL